MTTLSPATGKNSCRSPAKVVDADQRLCADYLEMFADGYGEDGSAEERALADEVRDQLRARQAEGG